MLNRQGRFQLDLLGAFSLTAPDGERLTVPGKRAKALLAMLATSRNGGRSRAWLQDRLWGSRGKVQAQASLRRELSNLRPVFGNYAEEAFQADGDQIKLDLDLFVVDARDARQLRQQRGDFLEGIDLGSEEGFEDWLRQERQVIDNEREAATAYGPLGMPSELPRPVRHLSGRPTLSVLVAPDRLSPEDAANLEGLSDDVVERLSRLRWLLLVGVPAGAVRVDDAEHAVRVGAMLGADYLLLCRIGSDRRLHLALSDAATGGLLWSMSYRIDEHVALETRETVVTEAVAAITAQVETDQELRVNDRGARQLAPDELLWRAKWHMRRLTRADAQAAEELLDRAAAERPGSADVLTERAYVAAWKLWNAGSPAADILALRATAARTRDMDPFHPRATLLLGILDFWLRRHEQAASLMREAIELNPSLAEAYAQLGSCQSLSGRPEDAVSLIRMALRLGPLDFQNFHQYGELALAELMLGHHAESVIQADNALARRPAYAYGHVLKIAAMWIAGDHASARTALTTFRQVKPNYDPSKLDWLPFKDSSWNALLKHLLAEAGGF